MLLEEAGSITTSGIFTEAGNTLTGFVTMAGNFFTSMWANPMGKIVIGASIASGAIALGYKLFFRRKHM